MKFYPRKFLLPLVSVMSMSGLFAHASQSAPLLHLVSSYNLTCVSTSDSVQCLGNNMYQQATLRTGYSHIRQISTGGSSVCVLDDGGVACFGYSLLGQNDVPFLANPKLIASSSNFNCAVDSEALKCWGYEAQLKMVPPPRDFVTIKGMIGGQGFMCGFDDVKVKCWGDLSNGLDRIPAVRHPKMITTGFLHACVLDDEGYRCWGDYASMATDHEPPFKNPKLVTADGMNQNCVLDDEGVQCWGAKDNGGKFNFSVPLQNPYAIASGGIAGGCALDDFGLQCWNDEGTKLNVKPPVIKKPTEISMGYSTTCVIDEDQVKCWGLNRSPDFKNGSSNGLIHPKKIAQAGDFLGAVDDNGLKMFAAYHNLRIDPAPGFLSSDLFVLGEQFLCAVGIDQKVQCFSQQGLSPTAINVPSSIKTVQSMVAGFDHVCILDEEGIKCWGSNERNQSTVPQSLTHPRSVAAGGYTSCAIDDHGLSCWGENDSHQLEVPKTLKNPQEAAVGFQHICAIDSDQNGKKSVVCWGGNDFGQLKVPKGIVQPRKIIAYMYDTCVLDDVGVKCWGRNELGQDNVPQGFLGEDSSR